MEIKSYMDMDGNKLVKGDWVEVIMKDTKIKKVEAMEKKGHMVLVKFEGEYVKGWNLARDTRKVMKA